MRTLLCILLTVFLGVNIHSQTTFAPKVTIDNSTGSNPYNVDSADVDGDNYPEILLSVYYGNKVLYYHNNGDGTFASAVEVTNSLTQLGAKFANIDNSNGLDIIATSYNGNKLVWFQHDGMGGYGSEQVISSTLNGASGFHYGDINGDTFIDIVVSATTDNKVVWFQNDGSGNFSSEQNVTSALTGPGGLDVDDFDGDGDLDVVISTASTIDVFYNELIPSTTVSFTQDSNTVSTGNSYLLDVDFYDVDNDGNLDITKGDFYGDFAWYKKEMDGTYSETIIPITAGRPGVVNVADLDNDTFKDVVASNNENDSNRDIFWYKSTATIPSTLGTETAIDATQSAVFGMTLNDFDFDGDIDIVTSEYYSGNLNIFYNELITLGTEEFDTENIKIYPNPVQTSLHLITENTNKYEIRVYNMLGQQVLTDNMSTLQALDVSKLIKGVYVLNIPELSLKQQFVKN